MQLNRVNEFRMARSSCYRSLKHFRVIWHSCGCGRLSFSSFHEHETSSHELAANDLYRGASDERENLLREKGFAILSFRSTPRHTYDPDSEYGSRVTSTLSSRANIFIWPSSVARCSRSFLQKSSCSFLLTVSTLNSSINRRYIDRSD